MGNIGPVAVYRSNCHFKRDTLHCKLEDREGLSQRGESDYSWLWETVGGRIQSHGGNKGKKSWKFHCSRERGKNDPDTIWQDVSLQ